MKIARNGQWLSATLGEECVLMSVETGNYVTLSRVGARIWELIDPPIAIVDLRAHLLRQFDVPAAICESEVDAFLAALVAARAITLSPE